MEVAASIVGLMAVGAQVCSTLNSFLAACQDAPIVVETTRDEIRDFHYALERLKDYVWQSEKITPLGRATTDTNQLVLTLASSMKTFAHVEKVLNPLLTQPRMDTLRRLRWARSSGDIEKLLIRIQSHKMTMNLLLTIWLSESTAQAEASNDILNDILKRLVDPNHQAAQVQHFDPTNYEVPTSDTSVEASISGLREGSGKSVYARSFMSVGKSFSIMSGRSLTSKLRNSKAYASPKAFDTSAQSVLSRGATPWSSYTIGSGASVFSLPFSGLELEGKSISQVKEIHRISFPLDGKTLYNEWWYPKADTKSGFPTEGVCTFLAVLGLKGKTQKPGTNGSPSPSTDIKSTIIPPSLIQTSNNELDIYLTKGGKHSSFLKERLRLSITDRHLPSIELLLVWSAQNRFGVSIGDELVDAFRGVVEQGDKYLTELFLNWGAYIEVLYREPDHSIFEGALKSHHSIEIVDLFLVYGADTEKGYGEPSYTPLQAAVIYPLDSSLGLARLLLDRGANNEGFCEEERRTPLELAISGKHYKMITMLLERGADPEKGYGNPPCTPLQAAALGRFDHSLELVKFLLDQGMSIEGCCNEERRKPLELAMASANYYAS